MKAIAYSQHGLPLDDPQSLYDTDIAKPQPGPRDLLVKIEAIAVNPVDTKVRNNSAVAEPRILGWDATGTVEAVGDEVSLFGPGDSVFYAGSITRPGCYSEYGLVDERIAGRKPVSLNWADSAALPLTSITAWELLFDRLGVPEQGGVEKSLLIMGAAGGVGSILTQLARQLTGLTVIGTASRDESQHWVKSLGAHHVINHHQPLGPQLADIGISAIDYVASLTQTDKHFAQLVELMAPQSHFGIIDDPAHLDATLLKRKSIALHWELMFTRSMFETPDMIEQHKLLNRVADLVDTGIIKTTRGEHFGQINAKNLRRAHQLIEAGRACGKIVLEGW